MLTYGHIYQIHVSSFNFLLELHTHSDLKMDFTLAGKIQSARPQTYTPIPTFPLFLPMFLISLRASLPSESTRLKTSRVTFTSLFLSYTNPEGSQRPVDFTSKMSFTSEPILAVPTVNSLGQPLMISYQHALIPLHYFSCLQYPIFIVWRVRYQGIVLIFPLCTKHFNGYLPIK